MQNLTHIPTIIATVAALNIGGAAAHAGVYAYVGGRYLLTLANGNRGQANWDYAQAFRTLCSGLPSSNPEDNQRENQSPCHAVFANRPEKKYLPADDEPEI